MKAAYLKIWIIIGLSTIFSAFSQNSKDSKYSQDSTSLSFSVEENDRFDDKCPDKTKRKKDKNGRVQVKGNRLGKNQDMYSSAIIEKREHTISFDVVFVEEYFNKDSMHIHFDNNQVSFTPEAQERFDNYMEKTKLVLSQVGYDTDFTLYVKGFASQIPTSFAENKESNNLNEDGSSKIGNTSIQNNLDLAHSRVLYVIGKIKEQIPEINIVMDKEKDVRIGRTTWTSWHQERLEIATKNKDTLAIDSLFAPFRAEQYVSITSNISMNRMVEPQAIKMYAITTLPHFVRNSQNGFLPIMQALIVSESTFDLIGDSLVFETIEERDQYLVEKGLELVHSKFRRGDRWFIVSTEEEKLALQIENEEEKIETLLKLGIVHYRDKIILEEILTKDYLVNDRYSYQVVVD